MVSVQFYWMNTKKVFNKFGAQNCLVIRGALGCYTKCWLISNKILRQREARNRYTYWDGGRECKNQPAYENSRTKIRAKLNIVGAQNMDMDFIKMKDPGFWPESLKHYCFETCFKPDLKCIKRK